MTDRPALDALDATALPVVARRAIAQHLDTAIPELQEKMKKMFGKEYKFEYDVRATLDKLSQSPDDISWFKDRINSTVPDFIARYFKAVVKNLEYKNFHKDDMLQEGESRWFRAGRQVLIHEQRSSRRLRASSSASRLSTSFRTASRTTTRSLSTESTACRPS